MRRAVRSPPSRETTAAISSSVWRLPFIRSSASPFADELDRARRRRVAVGNVHDPDVAEIDLRGAGGLRDLIGRTHQDGHDEPLPRRLDGPGERRCLAGVSDRGRNRLEAEAPLEESFVLSGPRLLFHCEASFSFVRAREGPVSFNRRARTKAMPTPYSMGANAVWYCASSIDVAPSDASCRRPAKTGPRSALNVKFKKVDDSGRGAPELRRIRLFDDGIREHRGTRGQPRHEAEDVRGEDVRRAVEDERHAGEKHRRSTENHRFSPPESIRKEAEQRAAENPAEGNRRRAQNRRRVVDVAGFLEIPHPPHHVEDGRRDEEEPCDQAAQDRLRIPEHGAESFHRAA